MKPTEGEPAFPNGPSGMSIHYEDGRVEHQYPGSPGMSLRQWYIGQALQGFCANPNFSHAQADDIALLVLHQSDHIMKLLYPQPKETNQ